MLALADPASACSQHIIVCEDAATFEHAAFRESHFYSMAEIAERRDARAQKNRMDVQADFVHQSCGQK